MSIKYSTGKGVKVRHSTGLDWDDLKKKKKKYDPIKHSTGEYSHIKHATGTEFDYKALYDRESEASDIKNKKESKDGVRLWDGTIIRKEGIHSKVRSKPKEEGEEYLELYQKSIGRESSNKRKVK